MKILSVITATATAAAAVLLATPASAATLEVCPVGCTYTSINAAVVAAAANDTVTVAAGDYVEPQIIVNKPLTIVGAGQGQTTVTGGAVSGIFQFTPLASTSGVGPMSMSGMTIRSTIASNYALYIKLNRPTTGITKINLTDLEFDGAGLATRSVYAASGVTSGANRQAPELNISSSSMRGTVNNNIGIDSYDGLVDIHDNALREGTNGNSAIFVGNEYTPYRLTGEVLVRDNSVDNGRLFYLKNAFGVDDNFAGYDKVTVTDNQILGLGAGDPGVFVGSNTNKVTTADPSIGDVTVTGNTIRGTLGAGSSGVTISGKVTKSSVSENDIAGTVSGVRVAVDRVVDNPTDVSVRRNRLIANTAGVDNNTASKVDAKQNWWGCQNGPLSASAFCSDVVNSGAGTVDTSTWIRARAALSANTVQAGNTLSVTGALDTLAPSGTTVSPLPVPPLVGKPVVFSATRGNVAPSPVPLDVDLEVNSTYTAPAAAGADTVRVVVDSETVGATTFTGEPIDLPLTVNAAPATPTTRFGGADRYETSVEVSKGTFPGGAEVVYVATGLDFADGLSGGPLAAREDGPLLLVRKNLVPASVRAEIARLSPDRIVILGGTSSVDAGVAASLGQLAAVTRLAGANRYGTAAEVSKKWDSSDAVYLASGEDFPDALSGGALAADNDAPMLLTRSDELPETTADQLKALAPSRVVILGGTTAVDASVEAAVKSAVTNVTVTRLAGADRYETSAKALEASDDRESGKIMLASGIEFADALVGGPAAHKLGAGFALTRKECVPPSVADIIKQNAVTRYYLLGGTSVIDTAAPTLRCAN